MEKILLLSLILSSKCFSQILSDSRTNSLANSNVADINPVSSAFSNPCGIIYQNNPIFILNYSNYFHITELSRINIAFINSINKDDFAYGINFERFGYYLYNENKISVFSSKKLYPWLELGIKANFFYNQIHEINKKEYFLTFDLGINYYINEKYLISSFFENPMENIILNNRKNISNIRLGINYREYKSLNIFLEYQQFIYFNNDIKTGIEYIINSFINISTGINFINKNFGLGIGFKKDEIIFHIGFLYQSSLNANMSSFLSYETNL